MDKKKNESKMALPSNFLIADKYKLIKMIGKGSFGEVYLAQDIYSNNQVAIKIETKKENFSQLTFESKVYRYLTDGVNIPGARLFVIDNDRRALVMELLGSSLEELHHKCGRRFTVKTVCILAVQMLVLLEYIHNNNIIHRDIKPDNFLMGIRDPSKVYIVDFGLAKQYTVSRVVPHVKYYNRKPMIGTARYASINAHLGIEQSRRDDLESLGFVIMYFLLGQLPWQGITGETKNRKYDRICERKLSISIEDLCSKAPDQFKDYFKYVRNLRFDEKPNYMLLRQLFHHVLQDRSLRFDYTYDWTSEMSSTWNHTPLTDRVPPQPIIQPPHVDPPHNPSPIRKPNPIVVSNKKSLTKLNNPNTDAPGVIRTSRSTRIQHPKVFQHVRCSSRISENSTCNCNMCKKTSEETLHKDDKKSSPVVDVVAHISPRYNLRSQKKDGFPNTIVNSKEASTHQPPKRRGSAHKPSVI